MPPILKKVSPGDKVKAALSATSWNTFIDTANKVNQTGNRPAPGGRVPPLPASQLYVRNNSGADVDRFGVLGVSSALIAPSDNAAGFAEVPAVVGVEPTTDHEGGRFVVLIEPIADGAVGRAAAGGICICKVNVSDADHDFAKAEDGNSAALVSAETGPVALLWKESGTGSGKWAIGRFGGGGSLPSPTQKYQVYTPIDDTLTPIWTTARFQ